MKYISKYDRISIYTAAVVIGKNVNWVRWALQDHLVPFGESVRSRQRNGKLSRRYSYYINKQRLAEYASVSVEEIERINREIKETQDRYRKRAKAQDA